MSANKATAIATALKKKIEEGKYGAGNPMPSVRALMRQHGVARCRHGRRSPLGAASISLAIT